MNPGIRLIGIGQALRGDDAAGIEALRLLLDAHPDLSGECRSGEALDLLNAFAGLDHAVVLDCVLAKPGDTELLIVDGLAGQLPASPSTSTHSLGLAEAVALGRTLDRLPGKLTVFGIPGCHFGLGEEMSADTQLALARLPGVFAEWRQRHA